MAIVNVDYGSTCRLHAFGIGTGVDRDLVTKLAQAGGGVHDFIQTTQDRSMESKIMNALRATMQNSAYDFNIKCTAGDATITAVSESRLSSILQPDHKKIMYFTVSGAVSVF